MFCSIFTFFLDASNWKLYLSNPILVFAILLALILLVPILFKKLHIPSVIGLLLAGIVIGPNGLNIIVLGESMKLLGTTGLLYLLFLVGLELDLQAFAKSRNRSIIHGFYTFAIPFLMGFAVTFFLLKYSLMPSLLISSLFSAHTLISYPIASRLGISKSEVMNVIIGGTILTDTAVFILLTVISGASGGELNPLFWVKMIASLAGFLFIIVWGVPRMSRWFFKNLETDSGSQYIYVLLILFASGFLAHLVGIEPIIGALFAGLALNRLIPHTSPLMNRVVFIGNTLFIPIFLISVGMLVDFRAFFTGTHTLILAGIFTAIAIGGKFLAAWVTQKTCHYSPVERNLMFGLTSARAASVIAVVTVGMEIHLVGLEVLNGVIIVILISCLVSSFATEIYGRKMALTATANNIVSNSESQERILVPVANPATVENLVDFAILIRQNRTSQPIYMLTVVRDDVNASEQILKNNKVYESAISHAAASDVKLELISRADLNIANGISRAIRETLITKMVIGWNGHHTTSHFFFGTLLDQVLVQCKQMITVVKLQTPLNVISRVIACVPPNAEKESGCSEWLQTLLLLAQRTSSKLILYLPEPSLAKISAYMEQQKISVEWEIVESLKLNEISPFADLLRENDLFVVISARKQTLSHQNYMEQYPRELAKSFSNRSFIIIYPEQKDVDSLEAIVDSEEMKPIFKR